MTFPVQDMLKVPRGTVRATVLIETIMAAFEMEEIIYELREHSSGLNCGRWDYIFSFIKKLRNNPNFVLPDRQATAGRCCKPLWAPGALRLAQQHACSTS